ncbi:TetR/AcrR family transcriptional regulator, partial [Bradyrhizobium sp. UFLA01-814]
IREKERLLRLSEGKCDLDDVRAIIDRVVTVSVMALTMGDVPSRPAARPVAMHGRLTRQDL